MTAQKIGEVWGIPVFVAEDFWCLLSADTGARIDSNLRVACLMEPLRTAVNAAMGQNQGPEAVHFIARIPLTRLNSRRIECGLALRENDLHVTTALIEA